MAKTFSFKLVTQTGVAAECDAESVVLPGSLGSLGVLAGHEPWVVLLRSGPLAWKQAGGGWQNANITGGVADISGTRTVVLADSTGKGG